MESSLDSLRSGMRLLIAEVCCFRVSEDVAMGTNTSAAESRQKTPRSGSGLEAQRRYLKALKAEHFRFNLIVADAFINGIRDIGYKSTATALDELIGFTSPSRAFYVKLT
jgi:hypothetical protein